MGILYFVGTATGPSGSGDNDYCVEGCTKICFSGFDFICLKDLILDVLVNSFSVIVGCKTSFLMTDCLVNELMNMLCKKSNV